MKQKNKQGQMRKKESIHRLENKSKLDQDLKQQ